MERLILDKQELKEFGKKSAIGFAIFALILFLLKKHFFGYFLGTAVIFMLLTSIYPKSLKYVYIGSMKIAEPISWFMSKVIFSIFFFVIITPIGLFLKVFGKDLLYRKIDKTAKTYWLKKEKKSYDQAHFERQF